MAKGTLKQLIVEKFASYEEYKKTEQTQALKLDTTRHLLNIGKCVDKSKRNPKGTTRK